MMPVEIEGVRRNFTTSSVFVYSVFLVDSTQQQYVVLEVERHEAVTLVAAINHLALPRPVSMQLLAHTLRSMQISLAAIHLLKHSMLPPAYNVCTCRLHWQAQDHRQAEIVTLCPGDVASLSLFMQAPLFVSADLFAQSGAALPAGQPLEAVLATSLLNREGMIVPEGKSLRLGFSKTPLRDALVKEVQACLLGKAPLDPEAQVDHLKQEYFAFVLGQDLPLS